MLFDLYLFMYYCLVIFQEQEILASENKIVLSGHLHYCLSHPIHNLQLCKK